MTSAPKPTIGFIGVGKMGWPMAGRLAAAQFPVIVFDAQESVAHRFVENHGGTVGSSLSELGKTCDIVITMLPNSAAVSQVILGVGDSDEDCLLKGLTSGKTVIDMSSGSPSVTVKLGRILFERGITMLDAPVSGGVKRAVEGKLAIMIGGDAEAVERCSPLFAAMGASFFPTGPIGSGHAMKALNNLVSASGLIAAAEALVIGRRFGLDPATMIDVLNASSGRNNATENKFRQFILSRSFASGFSLKLMVKDIGIAIDLARETGALVPYSEACHDLWFKAAEELEAGEDHTAVVRWLERRSGTVLENVSGMTYDEKSTPAKK